MTDRTKDLLTTVGAAVTAGVFGAGMIWGGTRAEITGKLDAQRFEKDSVNRAADERAHRQEQADRDSTLLKEMRTVRLILCEDRPHDSWCRQ